RDDTPPSLTCPADVTIECDQDPFDFELTGVGIAQDLCDPEPNVTAMLTLTVVDSPCIKVFHRYWIGTDDCGNGGSSELCIQTITLVDTTPPSIACPEDVTIECGDPLPTTLATATDNCNEVVRTYADSDPVDICPMVITRTHYATDVCGN